jgi:hypothetical protein
VRENEGVVVVTEGSDDSAICSVLLCVVICVVLVVMRRGSVEL